MSWVSNYLLVCLCWDGCELMYVRILWETFTEDFSTISSVVVLYCELTLWRPYKFLNAKNEQSDYWLVSEEITVNHITKNTKFKLFHVFIFIKLLLIFMQIKMYSQQIQICLRMIWDTVSILPFLISINLI